MSITVENPAVGRREASTLDTFASRRVFPQMEANFCLLDGCGVHGALTDEQKIHLAMWGVCDDSDGDECPAQKAVRSRLGISNG